MSSTDASTARTLIAATVDTICAKTATQLTPDTREKVINLAASLYAGGTDPQQAATDAISKETGNRFPKNQ